MVDKRLILVSIPQSERECDGGFKVKTIHEVRRGYRDSGKIFTLNRTAHRVECTHSGVYTRIVRMYNVFLPLKLEFLVEQFSMNPSKFG